MSPELNLPNTGPSNIEMYLPNDTKLMTVNKTLLLFEQLLRTAREAEVLPGLKKSLASINKWSEEGYTTIFHPGKKGVTVHNPGTLTMTTSKLPVLQGYKPRGANGQCQQTKMQTNERKHTMSIAYPRWNNQSGTSMQQQATHEKKHGPMQ
jgi:hypothetical protein